MSETNEGGDGTAAAPEPMTAQQAKARVARGVAAILDKMIAASDLTVAAIAEGVAKENEQKMTAAAKVLRSMLLVTAKRMERPKILQPRRALKVLRN
jgi:hypothetical protein